MNKERKLKYIDRDCLICGSHDWEVLYSKIESIYTINFEYKFELTDCICKNCGLIQMNPAPDQESLNDYYSDKYLHFEGRPDFNMENRIKFLLKISESRKTLLELGSNEGSFLLEANNQGFAVFGEDLNHAGLTEKDTRPDKFDIIIANHVLEHIVDPLNFLEELWYRLNENGLLIIEVPNLYSYNHFSTAISHEHLFHFSPIKLESFLKKAGFSEISFDFIFLSRPLGVTIIGFKNSEKTKLKSEVVLSDYQVNKSLYLAAVEDQNKKSLLFSNYLINLLNCCEGDIILWGVNIYMTRLLNSCETSKHNRLLIIDSSPSKWGKLVSDSFSLKISTPDDVKSKASMISYAVICAVSYRNDIQQTLVSLGVSDSKILTVPF